MKVFKAEPSRWYDFGDDDIGFFDNFLIKRGWQKPGFNRRMFDEDFARLFHSPTRRSDNLFEIVSNDDQLIKTLLGKVKTRSSPHTVDQTLRELVGEIAESLILFGRAYYFLHDDPEQKEAHIVSLSPDGIVRLFGTYIQWVPKRTERHWDRDDEKLQREIRILDPGRVMRFEIPKSTKCMLSAQNRTFAVLDKTQFGIANFHSPATHETPNPTNHFDFRVWNDTQERVLHRATRSTGWNCRKYDSSKRSDFFACHRLIRFRRNQLLLRDDILSQLSAELTKVGKVYEAKFSVDISGTAGLPSITHLDELEVGLMREEVRFQEIIDYCFGC